MKTRRPTKADAILAEPAIQRTLASMQQARDTRDAATLAALARMLEGRVMKPLRRQFSDRFTVRRDPRDVVRRYLRRARHADSRPWHAGGYHVARLDYGPGIAWKQWRNDQAQPVQCHLINLPA